MACTDTPVVVVGDEQMAERIPMKGGDEYDGLTKARRFYLWKAGQLKKIKRAYNKRFRKYGTAVANSKESVDDQE